MRIYTKHVLPNQTLSVWTDDQNLVEAVAACNSRDGYSVGECAAVAPAKGTTLDTQGYRLAVHMPDGQYQAEMVALERDYGF